LATRSLLVALPIFTELERMQRVLVGTSESRASRDWADQLAAFTGRNAGRRTRLEVDDPAIGAQTQETGYVFTGAFYDTHACRVQILLGEPGAGRVHLSRSIGDVDSVSVLTDASERDTALRIAHGSGQTLLTFLGAG
jgi:hypothetical protein